MINEFEKHIFENSSIVFLAWQLYGITKVAIEFIGIPESFSIYDEPDGVYK